MLVKAFKERKTERILSWVSQTNSQKKKRSNFTKAKTRAQASDMDSAINFFKGYGKVKNPPSSSASSTNHNRKPLIAAAISLIVLLTVIIGAIIGALIHESATEPPDSPSESIRSVCSVTRYPNSCFTSISSLNKNNSLTDPELIFALSLRVAIDELKTLSSLPKVLASKSNGSGSESAALGDCKSLFGDAVSRLGDAAEAVAEVGLGEKTLTEVKIGDLKTWISAAMTDQETCLDGLVEVGSSTVAVVDEVRSKVQRSNEYMSNSLAILNNIQAVLDRFHQTMH